MTISALDPVTAYARAVTSGEYIAGSDIRNACQRHINDLKNAAQRGYFFDLEKANRAIGFFKNVLKLNGGDYEGKPFILLPWQAFIVGSLFGWVDENGYRRFRESYVETGKGSGKSPLLAGIGLYGLVADGEQRAEVYAAATKLDQARILFRDAVAMVDQSPALSKRITKSGGAGKEYNLAYLQTHSFFRPISSDSSQSGPRPHIGLIDEFHEHKDATVVELLRAGSKSRKQALFCIITNSGTDKHSPCWQYHEYGSRVAAGLEINDQFFSFICGLDEGDDPFNDESCWYKSNPSLQFDDLPSLKYLREQVTAARGMPAKESIVRRLNFCQWVGAVNPWISNEIWKGLTAQFDVESLRGRNAYAGLDLSSTQDITSLVLLVEPLQPTDQWLLIPYFWLPDENLIDKEKTDGVPYLTWKKTGHLLTTPGSAIDKRVILEKLVELSGFFNIKAVGYDRWRMEDLKILADGEGLKLPQMVEHGQGYKDMAPAIDEFETLILGESILHNNNPVMNWCINNAVTTQDDAGNRKFSKTKATGRIDGVVAATMAIGVRNKIKPKPSYSVSFLF